MINQATLCMGLFNYVQIMPLLKFFLYWNLKLTSVPQIWAYFAFFPLHAYAA
jgi:hypothetical protein